MKRRKVLSVITFFLVCMIFLGNSYIFATVENSVSTEDKVIDNETEERKAQKKEILNMIDECIKDMKTRLLAIENKEAKVKKQKEFENYPAIRLNVDTPVFGFISMVDSKLKIRKDVSTVDVANGYSIKDIVNKNKIKLPDITVGSIVVTTRDVSINENMSYEDASLTLLKMMTYMSQLDSAEEFLDFQINKTFKGYIDKEKSDKMNDIKNRNNKITSSLIELDKKITYLHIIKNDDEKLKEINTLYDEISSDNKSINVSVKDMLMSEESLLALQKKVIDLEGDLIELTTTVDQAYNTALSSIDEEKMLKSIREELVAKRDYIKKYINDSVYTKKIESQEKGKEEENSSDEIITRYEITSKNTLDYLNNSIASIDDKIAKYVKSDEKEDETSKTNPISQEVANKNDVTNIEVKELTKEEKKNLSDEVYKIYIDFLAREDKFYLDNTNFLIKDTTNKISDLTGKTDGDVLSYTKYMYIELPGKLKEYINGHDMNSMRELKKLTNSLKNELVTIVDCNEKVTKLYNKMIQEELKS
ncbi:MAG: hypothetical protein Q4D02_03065 [Clostridia bacterium]|nr:hypothetical protein [Clostridia bacterium]